MVKTIKHSIDKRFNYKLSVRSTPGAKLHDLLRTVDHIENKVDVAIIVPSGNEYHCATPMIPSKYTGREFLSRGGGWGCALLRVEVFPVALLAIFTPLHRSSWKGFKNSEESLTTNNRIWDFQKKNQNSQTVVYYIPHYLSQIISFDLHNIL